METGTLPTVEEFKELVCREWSDPESVEGWRRWFPKVLEQFQAGTDLFVRSAELEPGMHVLDVASGSGDPALALADAVGPDGRVTATDSSAGMLDLAEAHARARGLTNLAFRQADAHALPFPDGSFDRVTSKLGVMYFVECGQALREIRRVLKPEGRVALLAWGPPELSEYVQLAFGPILRRAKLPPPPPCWPHPFRFAERGSLTAELGAAGFRRVQEEMHMVPMPWPGPPEELWQQIYDIAAPFRPVVDGLAPDERGKAVGEVLAGLRRCYDGTRTATTAAIVIASATR
ncbi:MAG: class I SAM-dependent methyltransferase [Thermomicrobiales bacterium]